MGWVERWPQFFLYKIHHDIFMTGLLDMADKNMESLNLFYKLIQDGANVSVDKNCKLLFQRH